ncbi:MAG: MIP/aquaporin family protein [Gemmatimonadota bacterium]
MTGKLLTELIGTFFLVLTIGLTVIVESPLAPLAIGSALMVMVYMGGHISGAHYNPAVTLAIWARGAMPAREVGPYWIAQLLGSFLAAVATWAITWETFAPAPGDTATVLGAFLVEILFTLALGLVVLETATAPETKGNSFYGLAIGFTVAVGAFAGGGISGGAFNPAVGLGPILFDGLAAGGTLSNAWLYVVAPVLGGLIAAGVYRIQRPGSPTLEQREESRA